MPAWEPAVYEHKAALIGQPVLAVSRSSTLLAAACLAEYERYAPRTITVGIDVYSAELEACGARVVDMGPTACPDIAEALHRLDALPDRWPMPAIPGTGRFGLLLEAAARVRRQVACPVRIGVCGPVSLAARMVGMTDLLLGLAVDEPAAARVLDWCTELAGRWCREIRNHGLEVTLFDSMAAPPNLSPTMYSQRARPLHAALMTQLAHSGQQERPLIVGGNTTPIAAEMAATGATYLVCDFPADAGYFAEVLGEAPVVVRRNVAPMLFARPTVDASLIQRTVADLSCFARPVLGTGVLPYATDPRRVCALRDAVFACVAASSAATLGGPR